MIAFSIFVLLKLWDTQASVVDKHYDQYISHQYFYSTDTAQNTLPFDSYAVDALYDKNGKCFVLMTSDNLLWSSREKSNRDKVGLEPAYAEWKKIQDFSDLGTNWKIVKAPDSIILLSNSMIYEIVLDFSCSFVKSVEPRVNPSTSTWGEPHSAEVAFDSLWVGSNTGLLRFAMKSPETSQYWSVEAIEGIPASSPVRSLAAQEQWGVVFASTESVFYEVRGLSSTHEKYHVHHDWVGGNIDSPVVDMQYDAISGCMWVVEGDALHCRDAEAMWWRFGYYQGAVTANITSVAVTKTRGSQGGSYVWTGSRDKGLVRLRVDGQYLKDELEAAGAEDSWTQWLLFYGPRFLPDGHVQMLVSDDTPLDEDDNSDGRDSATLLVLTDEGITFLATERWSLREKQEAMQSFQYPRHDRNGIVAEVSLQAYADLSTYWHNTEDSDSIWTAQYVVAASFRYASSGLEEDRKQAWRSFEALEMLGNITGVEGLVGRTMCSPSERASSEAHYFHQKDSPHLAHRTSGCGVDGEGNWHESKTMPGWVWKGDTSSDTVDGHYFAYGAVLDLVAKGEGERRRVTNAIDRLTAYIVSNDLYYIDVTGEPTKWGRWNPADLNENPEYISERGGNSLEILSFLALAYSVTGKDLYADKFHELVTKHNYFENVKNQKIDNPYDDNHSDNELGFMAYHTLFYANKRLYMGDCQLDSAELERRKEVLAGMTDPVIPSIRRFWRIVRNEKSPLWIAGVAGAAGVPVAPVDLLEAVESLQLWSIDMIGWGVRNTGRWDCETQPYYGRDNPEEVQMRNIRPPQERITGHWNINPFKFDTTASSLSAYDAGGGMVEYSPAEWLLPYWMMNYYGLIVDPA